MSKFSETRRFAFEELIILREPQDLISKPSGLYKDIIICGGLLTSPSARRITQHLTLPSTRRITSASSKKALRRSPWSDYLFIVREHKLNWNLKKCY